VSIAAKAAVHRHGAGPAEAGRELAPVVVVAAATVAFYAWKLAALSPAGGLRLALWPLVALGAWLATTQSFDIRNRRASVSLAADGVTIVTGIVFLRPAGALLALLLGLVVAQLQTRRSVAKKLFNATMEVGAASAGILVYHQVLGRASVVSTWGWLAIAAAVAVVSTVDLAGVVLFVMWVNRSRAYPPPAALLVQMAVDIALGTAAGAMAVSLVWASPLAVVLLVLLVYAGTAFRRRSAEASQRSATVEKIYELTRELASMEAGVREVVNVVLEAARTLLVTSRAVIMLPLEAPSEHLALRCELAGEGQAACAEVVPHDGFAALVQSRGPLVLAPGRGCPDLQGAMAAAHVAEGVVAPLSVGEGAPGYLMAADRPFAHRGFDDVDLELLGAVAADAQIVLRRSELMEKLRSEETARHDESKRDRLTGLANRAQFSERLQNALQYGDPDRRVALVLADLDGFKQVNDGLGHNVGDVMLTEVAKRLGSLGSTSTLVARLGGDEFVLLVDDAPGDDACVAVGHQVVAALEPAVAVNKLDLGVSASVGVAASAAGETTGSDLLRHADIAMYQAKAQGGGVCLYDPASDIWTVRRLVLPTELRKAIETRSLTLHYQPIVNICSGVVIGCEALARWEHDGFGPIGPDEFIAVAERSGLIDQLTWLVLDKALAQAKRWRQVVPGLTMSVNLSARSLVAPDIAGRVRDAISAAGLSPDALRLEVTESSIMADLGGRALEALRELGASLSIDDFGTGYSSLARLRSLPFDEVKIDKSFVSEMCRSADDEAVVRSVIELAAGLGKTVTAEGVEDEATLRRLGALGCDAAQGFYLSRPLPAEELEAWLVAQVGRPIGSLRL